MNSTVPWNSLAKWSPTAFVLAGVFRLINMAVYQAGELLASFEAPELALDAPLLLAFELAFVGLLGLYPHLKEERPRLAAAGVIIVLISAGSVLIVTTGEYVLQIMGAGADEPPVYLIPFQIAYFLGIPLSFLAVGGVSVRLRIPSLRIGGLLMIVGASWLVVLTGSTALIDAAGYLFGALMIVVGYLLYSESNRVGSEGDSVDTVLG